MNGSLWLDEATTALISKMSVHNIFSKFLPGDFHPPLYYLLMKFWVSALGNSEVSLRIPSLIFALLAVYVIYRSFGKISAILLATGPLLFYYAQEARMYSFAMFLVVCLIACFVKIIKKGSVGDYLIFSVLLSLVFLTDYVAVLIIPTIWITAIILKKDFIWWKKFIASHIILLISGALWFPYFIEQLSNGLKVSLVSPVWSQVLGQTSIKNLALIPTKFMIGRIGFDNKLLYLAVLGLVGLLFLFLIYKGRNAGKIVWIWIFVPIILGAMLSFIVSFLTYFRFLFVLPAFYILVANGIKNLGKCKGLFLILILLINLSSIIYYLITPKFHREDWRGAAKTIGADRIIFPANSQKEALIYYGRGNQIVYFADFKGGNKKIWLSRYVQTIFDPSDLGRKKIESLGYNKVGEYDFNGVVFWKYELP